MKRDIRLVILSALVMPLIAGLSASVPGTQQSAIVYKTEVRTVEIHAMVKDSHGRYIEGLQPGQFEIRDNGELQQISGFEPMSTAFDCAILLDGTGSMEAAMPALKRAVLELIDAFRDQDRFAVYAFNTTLRMMQYYSRDKTAAKRAVLRLMPWGGTALYDSLSEVAADLAELKGKKAIIVFTDGQDNSSYLNSMAAAIRAKTLGIPIYTVAQGRALGSQQLVRTLKEIARATGGEAYEVRKTSQVGRVFSEISEDIRHAYLLTYAAPPADDGSWRTIQVTLKGMKSVRIRAREGYSPR